MEVILGICLKMWGARRLVFVLFYQLFAVKRRPLQHHHNELDSQIKTIETFRIVVQALSEDLFWKMIGQVLTEGFFTCLKYSSGFHEGVPKE